MEDSTSYKSQEKPVWAETYQKGTSLILKGRGWESISDGEKSKPQRPWYKLAKGQRRKCGRSTVGRTKEGPREKWPRPHHLGPPRV